VSSFEHVVFSHRVRNDRVGHGRLIIGPSSKDPEILALAEEVLKERGIRLEIGRLFSLGWDFDRELIKVYQLHDARSSAGDPELKKLTSIDDDQALFSQRLSCTGFKKGRPFERKLIVAYRASPPQAVNALPFAGAVVSTMQIRRLGGESDWHLRLRGFHLGYLSPAGYPAAREHVSEFAQPAISLVWRDRANYTLYYP
jgi:hypothetical protein